MSEEIDLSQFDDIPDRVARGKAKAEAIKKMREGGASDPPSAPVAEEKPAEAPPPDEAAPAEEAPVAAASEGGGEPEVDLSEFDSITDRVARGKAKAEAMRKARSGGGGATGGAAPAKKAPAKKATAGAGDRAAAARALTDKGDGPAQVIVQTSPSPPGIRPGPDRILPLATGGITTRRGFFSWLTLAWVSFGVATTAALAATGRFLFPNVLFEPPQSFKIGFPENYDLGVDERWKDKFSVWVIKEKSQMYALISVCTHLGCTPNWLAGEAKFKCPCHGSGFYSTGINFEGPAPRPLERARIVLAEDGQILIDKNTKYQWEKGQWENPESFLKLI
jgi:cytochrome b6-f complex iron-sulfur subunit